MCVCVCERELRDSFIIPTMAHRLAFCGMIIRVSQSFVSSLSYLYWPSTSWSAKQGPRSLARPPAVAGGFASLQQPGMLHNLWLLGIHLRVARSLPSLPPSLALGRIVRRKKEGTRKAATATPPCTTTTICGYGTWSSSGYHRHHHICLQRIPAATHVD